jgi:predicted LPLAT superfamily acyltransferase
VILDRFAVFSSRKNLFDIELIGNERFMQLLESEKGFVIVGSHVGNFEIAGYFFSQNKKKINAIVYGGEAEIVQRNRSKLLNDNNVELIPVCDDMSHLFAANIALQRGEIVSMPADRLFGSAKSVECQFLNNKANFPVGAFALATTFDIDVLAIFCIKISANKYKIFVQPLCTNVAHNAHTSKKEKISNFVQNYVSELEKIVKKYPEQWFNFYEFWKK